MWRIVIYLSFGFTLLIAANEQSLTLSLAPKEQFAVMKTRETMLAFWMKNIQGKSESDLISNATDPSLSNEIRIPSAILLLKEHDSEQARHGAIAAFVLKMPAALGEWEGGLDWRREYPVAAALLAHPEMMRAVIQSALHGEQPERESANIFEHYKLNGLNLAPLLAELRKTVNEDEQRKRCDRFLAVLDGTILLESLPKDKPQKYFEGITAGFATEPEPEAKRVWPPGRKQSQVDQFAATANPHGAGAVAAIPAKSESFSRRFYVSLGLTAVLAGIAGWLVVRARQGKE